MRFITIFVVAFTLTMAEAAAQSITTLPSRHSVADTVDRLVKDIEARGMRVAARVDHAAGAKAAGLELPPTVVVMFGNPKLGTPLMQANPQIGLDLPMRVLVWQDKAGKVWIGYTPPSTLQARYGLTKADQVSALRTMAGALDGLARAAGN